MFLTLKIDGLLVKTFIISELILFWNSCLMVFKLQMDELLAIIIIVVLCCIMFFAWLVSMATCPDAMVSFLSGHRPESTAPSAHESKELIQSEQDEVRDMVKSVSAAYLHMNSARRQAEDKKLSVVPEQDEQLTVQSTIHSLRPTILRVPNLTSTPGSRPSVLVSLQPPSNHDLEILEGNEICDETSQFEKIDMERSDFENSNYETSSPSLDAEIIDVEQCEPPKDPGHLV